MELLQVAGAAVSDIFAMRRYRPRKFSDQQLIQCQAEGLSMAEAGRKLGVVHSTLQVHVARLGLVMAQKAHRAKFTADDDALIRKCSRGEVTMAHVERMSGRSYSCIHLRARDLGVFIPVKHMPQRRGKVYAARDYDLGDPISVGDPDKLLKKLFEVFKYPRAEVYPGLKA